MIWALIKEIISNKEYITLYSFRPLKGLLTTLEESQ